MNADLGAKIDRRRLLTTLASGAALASASSLISHAAVAAPERIFRFAVPREPIVITSAGLIAMDPGLCRQPSTETLVDELARRLRHSLLREEELARLLGRPLLREMGELVLPQKRNAKLFALGSVTLDAPQPDELILELQTVLDRQSAFVSENFGPLLLHDLPLFTMIWPAYTDECYADSFLCKVIDTVACITRKSGYAHHNKGTPNVFEMAGAPRYKDRRGPGALDLIALWPLNVGGRNPALEATTA